RFFVAGEPVRAGTEAGEAFAGNCAGIAGPTGGNCDHAGAGDALLLLVHRGRPSGGRAGATTPEQPAADPAGALVPARAAQYALAPALRRYFGRRDLCHDQRKRMMCRLSIAFSHASG